MSLSTNISLEIITNLFNTLCNESSNKEISIDLINKYLDNNKLDINTEGFISKLNRHGNISLPSLINLIKESYKNINKFKVLNKTKLEKKSNKHKYLYNKLIFNNFELVFLLEKTNKDKLKYNNIKIEINVENELTKEVFKLDDHKVIGKLKLLNLNEKFVINALIYDDNNKNIKTENNLHSIPIKYVDLDKMFFTDKINFQKHIKNYVISVSLNVKDIRQKEIYESIKNDYLEYKKLTSNYEELIKFVKEITRLNKENFIECFKFINNLFLLDESNFDFLAIGNKKETLLINTKNNKDKSYISYNQNNSNKNIKDEFSFKNNVKELTFNQENLNNISNSLIVEEEPSFFGDTNSFVALDRSRSNINIDEEASNPLNRRKTARKTSKNILNSSIDVRDYKSNDIMDIDKNSSNNCFYKTTNFSEKNNIIQQEIFNKINIKGELFDHNINIHKSSNNKNKDEMNKKSTLLTNMQNKNSNNNSPKKKNLMPKATKLVTNNKENIKAEYNPFKKSNYKENINKYSNISDHEEVNQKDNSQVTNVGYYQNDESYKCAYVDDKIKSLINDKVFNSENLLKKTEKGSLISLLSFGIKSNFLLFASDFNISTIYQTFLVENSKI